MPHHIAGLVCGLFGFLLVWMAKGRGSVQSCLCSAVAGVAFASAFGLSTWVALAFAMVLPMWMLWVLVWQPQSRARVPVLLGAGLVAALAVLPYVLELRGAPVAEGTVAGNAAHLLHFGVRHIIEPNILLALPWIPLISRACTRQHWRTAWRVCFSSSRDTSPSLASTDSFSAKLRTSQPARLRRGLGLYGLDRLDEADRTSLVLACAGLFVATFFRSTVIENNDFGYRSVLIAQFFLLLLAVRWFEGAFAANAPRLRALRSTPCSGSASPQPSIR